MVSGISLANKCQLLFGFAVVVILAAALSVPWIRTRMLVGDYQVEEARRIADSWLADRIQLGTLEQPGGLSYASGGFSEEPGEDPMLRLSFVPVDEIDEGLGEDDERGFLADALRRFREDSEITEHARSDKIGGQTVYRYARAIRESQMRAIRDFHVSIFSGPVLEEGIADPLRAILIVDRNTQFAEGQLLRSRIFIISSMIVGSLLAILVFYFILTKLILSPVRHLRETAEKVQAGDLAIRSDINTGDEFQQLAEAFNTMLDRVEQSQAQLQAMNETLDLKVDELAEANIGLYESNRLKGEFLANVSHELRTPLNSIIGFAELLQELARADDNADPKRMRYVQNILSSGRSLSEMINELLDMAKIEAGRMEINVEQTSVSDLIEGLVRVMRPQAEARNLELRSVIGARVPVIETDPGKLQQIIYNFLSNAIKFTPEGGTITISADRVTRQDNSLGVRLAVADTGAGIPEDMQDVIFEKFRQIDSGHTREHTGTGLGLAICRELAQMLGASVSFVSEPGRGATFFVDLPLVYQPDEPQPLMA
ncbi:MAG: HAMP domain-containing sensor histidine kinase [Planctomycetota bacterium]|nr:HAMP domain-containing sensor histidine kinase [Planctomycetota bacterium]